MKRNRPARPGSNEIPSRRGLPRGGSTPDRLSRSRTAVVIVSGLLVAAGLDAITGAFLRTVYPGLMRVNTGSMDWSLPAVLGGVLALILFPYRSLRRLPGFLAASVSLIAGVSSILVTRATEPPIAREHIIIALALAAFVVAGTLKAMVAAAFVRMPTRGDVKQGAAELAVAVAGEVVLGAIGGLSGGGSGSGGSRFDGGGGSFGGGGASGSW